MANLFIILPHTIKYIDPLCADKYYITKNTNKRVVNNAASVCTDSKVGIVTRMLRSICRELRGNGWRIVTTQAVKFTLLHFVIFNVRMSLAAVNQLRQITI